MRLLLTALLCFLLTAPAWTEAAAQDFVATPVEVSTDKVNVKGTVYLLHKVLKGHTLYSISKAYGVSIDAVREANPSLSEGLKAGMLLYIPAAGDTGVTATTDEQTAPAAAAPDTLTQDRKTKDNGRKAPDANRKKYRKYNVKWYETLDDVAVKFNVTTDAIIALNRIDPDSDKRIRSVFIPDDEYMRGFRQEMTESGAESLAENDTSDAEGQTFGPETVNQIPVIHDKAVSKDPDYARKTHVISLILPFNASRRTDGLNTYTADFYAGTLIALTELEKRGMLSNIVLNIVDLSNYSSAWQLVADGVLNESELIIGPISERDMQPVASWARSRKIPVVSPLDLKTAALADGNPYLYIFPPQSDLALDHQLDKIALRPDDSDTTSSVTVIYEQGYDNSDLVRQTMEGLSARGIPYKTFKYDFLSGRGIDSRMVRSLDTVLVNKVIIPSMSEAFITDALRNLSLIESSREYRIEVYGMSRWKSFETIELNYFHSLDLRLAMSYHIDYTSQGTLEFIHKYRAAFNTEPTSFAFQGYDILTFFVEAMNTWGSNFPQGIINERKSLLQSDVLFLPVAPGSGYENRAFKDICFTDGWTVLNE